MGMFTKLFQKSHDPYDLKGRWYRFETENLQAANPFFTCDNAFDPAGFSVSGSNLFFTLLDKNLKPVEAFYIRDLAEGSTFTSGLTQGYASVYTYADGRTAFQASQFSNTGRLVAYVYCI